MTLLSADLRARDIIQALRSGTVPRVGLREIAVGCDKIIGELHTQLDYVSQDRSEIKFIQGGYGAGKTFICSLFRQIALESKFCATTVVVSPDIPLGQQHKIYAAIVDGLRTPEKHQSCAFSDIMEYWLWRMHKRIEKIEGLRYSSENPNPQLIESVCHAIATDLGHFHVDGSFISAIQGYYRSRADQNPTLAQSALSWLFGLSDSVPSEKKNKLGLKGDIRPNMGFSYLRGLLKLIQDLGYSGLVIVIDEVETIMRLPHAKQRQEALETIRIIVDEAGQNNFPRCLFLITGTDRFFQDERYGLPSYEALRDRIDFPTLTSDFGTPLKQPLYVVQPLREGQLLEVASRVRDIHALAYNWEPEDRIAKEDIQRYATVVSSNFGGSIEQIPRGFLRGFIHLCDLLQENEELTIDDVLGDPRSLTEQVHEVESRGMRS